MAGTREQLGHGDMVTGGLDLERCASQAVLLYVTGGLEHQVGDRGTGSAGLRIIEMTGGLGDLG